MGRARQRRPLEASRCLPAAAGLSFALFATSAAVVPPCFNVDEVYTDKRNTTLLYPNGGFVVGAKACQQACKARGPFCKYFSWMRSPDPSKKMGMGACWVHEDVGILLGKATTISGPQNCDPGDAGGFANVDDILSAGAFPGEASPLGAAPDATGQGPLGTLAPLPTLPAVPTLPAIVMPTMMPFPGAPTVPPIASPSAPSAPSVPSAPEGVTTPAISMPTKMPLPAVPTSAPKTPTASPADGGIIDPTALTVPPAAPVPSFPPMTPTSPPAAGGIFDPAVLTFAPAAPVPTFSTMTPTTPPAEGGVTAPASVRPGIGTRAPAGPSSGGFHDAGPVNNRKDGETMQEEDQEPATAFPWWGYLLIAVGACACCGIVFLFASKDGKGKEIRKKKKRSGLHAESEEVHSRDIEVAPMLNAPTGAQQGPDLFDLIDSNHDGRITEAEFAAAMGGQAPAAPVNTVQLQQRPVMVQQPRMSVRPVPPPQPPRGSVAGGQGPDLFDLIDRNHDGRITGAEFAAAMGTQAPRPSLPAPQPPPMAVQPPRPPAPRPGQGPDLFDVIDRNHDGRITGAEFAAAMGGQVPPRGVMPLLRR